MAKAEKKDEPKLDYDPSIENPDGSLRTMKQKQEERLAKAESLLLEALPELWRFRRILQHDHRSAGESCNLLYIKFRDALGDAGQKVDAQLCGRA